MTPKYFTGMVLGLALLANGCGFDPTARLKEARDIAHATTFSERHVQADPFLLTVFERIGQPGQAADVYIEGDGLAWISRNEPSLDPTPTDPVAMRLAAKDPAANVIYIARPCQYTKLMLPEACPIKYWTSDRFAPVVITAMNRALDDAKEKHSLSGINLVGFSGGGAVAALMAAQRRDVASLRTVAGNLDPDAFSRIHEVTPLLGSLNPVDFAAGLSHTPQHHFVGAQDDVVPMGVVQSFVKASGATHCIRTTQIADATHEKGWTDIWAALLQAPVDCTAP